MIGHESPSHVRNLVLPPTNWAFGRVILTLEIHDSGDSWDKWDRNGYFYIVGADGKKHDIAPFITSYRTPGRWKVDVTHFRPWLAGEVKIEIAIQPPFDEGKGYMMSASLDYYHGIPQLEPFRIVSLWHGTARYKSSKNHFSDFFVPSKSAYPRKQKPHNYSSRQPVIRQSANSPRHVEPWFFSRTG